MYFNNIDFIILVIYFVGITTIAQYVVHDKSGSVRTSEDYFLAGRSWSWWVIGVSLIAANISAEQNNLPNEYEFFRGQALGSDKEFVLSSGSVEVVDSNSFVSKDGLVKTSLFQYQKQDDSKMIDFTKDGISSFVIKGEPLNLMYLENPYLEIVYSLNLLRSQNLGL